VPAMTMEICQIILFVKDMQAQVAFYRDKMGLKVKFPAREDFSKEHWVELDSGPCTLALHAGGQGRIGEDAPKITFRVKDIHAARAELVKRGVKLSEVRKVGPGIEIAGGTDPEGNSFSLHS
jgi:predicted enzyme related to lactoylglutathione lyase